MVVWYLILDNSENGPYSKNTLYIRTFVLFFFLILIALNYNFFLFEFCIKKREREKDRNILSNKLNKDTRNNIS